MILLFKFTFCIGTAASCIFPLLGATLNNWNFVATDIDQNTIQEAADNIKRNSQTELIQVMLTKPENIFEVICILADIYLKSNS